jgi:predicted amidohydrolase YtcJ
MSQAVEEAHGHGHGAHASPLTRERAGELGVYAAGAVALMAIVLQIGRGSLGAGVHHEEEEPRSAFPPALAREAEVIFTNAHVIQPGYEDASVIAVSHEGTIVGVGGDELLQRRTSATLVRDLGGGYVLPGLRDGHGHLAELGRKLLERVCSLQGDEVNRDAQDVVQAFDTWIKIKHPNLKPGEWLEGSGWDQTKWQTLEAPSREELAKAEEQHRDFQKETNQGYKAAPAALPISTELLDRVAPDNPVILMRVDGHCAWVNQRALQAAKITHETFDPPGGKILRDERGMPTGVLLDTAVDLIAAAMPKKKLDDEVREAEEDLLAACKACARSGLVEVHDAGVDYPTELALRDLVKKGQLPIRVYAMVGGSVTGITERLSVQHGPVTEPIGGLLTIRAVKLYADGALGSRGAHLLEPYADDPNIAALTPLVQTSRALLYGTRALASAPWQAEFLHSAREIVRAQIPRAGLQVSSEKEMRAIARLCAERGWQLCTHAIGDGANRQVLEIYESALRGKTDLRWRVEHAQVVDPEDMDRFARLGVIASMQPTHATSDMRWAQDRLGAARLEGAYAWRTLLGKGARLSFGSDFPVESQKPLLGLYAAVTRQDADGKPEGGWLPKEKLSPREALELFTEGPAYASFAEGRRGKILPGMDADFTVFEENPLEVLAKEPRKAVEIKVTGTFVGGKDAAR